MVTFGKTWADLEATQREVTWRGIRSLRADPPGLATGSRQATFAMALEQAEQLFIAAASTGPAARPLLLFYGLSQAGKALIAARVRGNPWKPKSHGIGEASDNMARTSVADFRVAPRSGGTGAFSLVAAALQSSGLSGPTRLGDLWPLLPETHRFSLPDSGPHALVGVHVNGFRPEGTPTTADITGLPANLGAPRVDGEDPSLPRADAADEERRVSDYLSAYPTLVGYRFGMSGGQPIGFQRNSDGTAQVRVHWPDSHKHPLSVEDLRRHVSVTYAGHTNAYPCLDGSGRAIHPLVVWWATLFGLSILARYEPEAWSRAIDINASAEAVAVEHLLDAALDTLPELLLRTLVDEA